MTLRSEWQRRNELQVGDSEPKERGDEFTESGSGDVFPPSEAPWLPLLVYRATFSVNAGHRTVIIQGDGVESPQAGGCSLSLLEEYWRQQLMSVTREEGLVPTVLRSHGGEVEAEAEGSDTVVFISDWQGEAVPRCRAMWSTYYEHYPRTPDNTELAEWVAKRYTKRRRAINLFGSGGGTISDEG